MKGKFALADLLAFINPDQNKVLSGFLYSLLDFKKSDMAKMMKGAANVGMKTSDIENYYIPVPSLSIQEEIVAEIEGYQKIIVGAKMVVENYKPKIDIDPEWEMVELGEVCEIRAGGTPSRAKNEYWKGDIHWYSSGELNEIYTTESKEKITVEGLKNSNATIYPKGSLLIGMYDTAAFKMSLLDREATFNQAVCGVKPNKKIDLYFLMLFFIMNKEEYLRHRVGVRQRNLNKGFIYAIRIPLISLEAQHQIVARIEKEQALVNANKELIAIFEQKIKDRIGKVWGETAPNPLKGALESAAEDGLMAAEPRVEYGKK